MSESVKIVIEIPKDIYERCKEYKLWSYDAETLEGAVATSKPLSENKGEWIVREDNTSFVKQIPRRWVECSHCGWSFSYDRIRDDFCSKCGADMRAEHNDGLICTECECKDECDGIEYMSKDQCEKKRGWQ